MSKNSPIITDLLDFLDHSPTAWHAVAEIKKKLESEGFIPLKESDPWKIQPGKKYSVERNGSSLCAFIVPQEKPESIRLIASHTDSPSFKLKPRPEIRKNKMIMLGVEVYGAPLLSSWLNRDLGLAGRIIYQDRDKALHETLVILDEYPVTIPQLAIHLDREVNEKGLLLNKQEHLNALAGLEKDLPESSSYLDFVVRKKIKMDQLIDCDLFLYPLEKARRIGFDRQLIASYRLDSLASVHAILEALAHCKKAGKNDIKMAMFWDNEEIGSQTAQGADSPFFNQTIERLIYCLKLDRDEYFRLLARSGCISVDLAHALHPNYPDKHDSQHQPMLGSGVILKHNAQQRYATDARSSIPVQALAKIEKIPLQKFVSRNDIPSGTTIGPVHAAGTGMPTADIGCGQLSMHSCRELMACADHLWLCQLLTSLFNADEWPSLI